MCKCKKCKEDVNLLDTYVYFGSCWIRWVCPKCNYELNYKRTVNLSCKGQGSIMTQYQERYDFYSYGQSHP